MERARVALVGGLQGDRYNRAAVQIDRVLGLVRQMCAPVLHLRNPRILVDRALPLLVRRALLALAIQPLEFRPLSKPTLQPTSATAKR